MTVRSFDTERGPHQVESFAQSTAHARRHLLRNRLVVIGPSVRDVVQFAGGWMFDRVTAGWDALALVSDHPDLRPLRILGVRALDLDTALATPTGPYPNELAVSVDLFRRDDRVRRGLLEVLEQPGDMSVTLWGGDDEPTELDERFGPRRHRLSSAARAFKAQALAAASVPAAGAGNTESLWTDVRFAEHPVCRILSD